MKSARMYDEFPTATYLHFISVYQVVCIYKKHFFSFGIFYQLFVFIKFVALFFFGQFGLPSLE